MGLKGGETGVKAQFKSLMRSDFLRFETLVELRDAVIQQDDTDLTLPSKRDQTVVFMDGNVLMMSVPEAVGTLDAFSNIIYKYVRDAVRAGAVVVVVFDEPQHLTNAKKEEQARRDTSRALRTVTTSADMQTCPLSDDFTREQLKQLPDVHILKTNRACRSRFYDEVVKMVFERIAENMEKWNAAGHNAGVFVLDGVEARGCDRPPTEPRETTMVGTDDAVVEALCRDVPIGEGDIKLTALENRVRHLVGEKHSAFEKIQLAITSTTDTDSFAIMLLDVAKRRVSPYSASLHSIFCMREPPSKRAREVDPDVKASFLCCDVVRLEAHIQEHLWSKSSATTPTPEQMLHAMTAFTSAAAICGCDFTLDGLKGARFDHFWESIPQFVASEPQALAQFGAVHSTDATVARQAIKGLYRVCVNASAHMETKPRYKKQAQTVSEVSDTLLLRAVWTASYWSLNEHTADTEWGFQPVLRTPDGQQ